MKRKSLLIGTSITVTALAAYSIWALFLNEPASEMRKDGIDKREWSILQELATSPPSTINEVMIRSHVFETEYDALGLRKNSSNSGHVWLLANQESDGPIKFAVQNLQPVEEGKQPESLIRLTDVELMSLESKTKMSEAVRIKLESLVNK